MSRLNEFRDMIDKLEDLESLRAGKALLDDLMMINKINEQKRKIEETLLEGGKAMFYFFAEELDEDELIFAAERMSGKIKRVSDREEKRDEKCEES